MSCISVDFSTYFIVRNRFSEQPDFYLCVHSLQRAKYACDHGNDMEQRYLAFGDKPLCVRDSIYLIALKASAKCMSESLIQWYFGKHITIRGNSSAFQKEGDSLLEQR